MQADITIKNRADEGQRDQDDRDRTAGGAEQGRRARRQRGRSSSSGISRRRRRQRRRKITKPQQLTKQSRPRPPQKQTCNSPERLAGPHRIHTMRYAVRNSETCLKGVFRTVARKTKRKYLDFLARTRTRRTGIGDVGLAKHAQGPMFLASSRTRRGGVVHANPAKPAQGRQTWRKLAQGNKTPTSGVRMTTSLCWCCCRCGCN